MTPEPTRTPTMIECHNCGAGAPLREHFCPQCTNILQISRHGDYFMFFGLPRMLVIDPADLEKRFRDLSRQFHPDFFHNGPPASRLASLERSSYLNDAYRVLKNPAARAEYLLGLEGLSPLKAEATAAAKVMVPAALLEEVFAFNEELDEIREARESGASRDALAARLERARTPIVRKHEEHERQIDALSAQWDQDHSRTTLEALRECLLERHYLTNLLATIEREAASLAAS
ncbi:MAG: Fe-S protein assembly co-chaperone HscB [Vicinamibacterales bacterium]